MPYARRRTGIASKANDSLKTLKMTLETLFLTRPRGREFRKQPLDSRFISCQIFSLIHGKDQHDERIILYGVNEPIALLAKLNLVAICQSTVQPAAWHVRVIEPFA